MSKRWGRQREVPFLWQHVKQEGSKRGRSCCYHEVSKVTLAAGAGGQVGRAAPAKRGLRALLCALLATSNASCPAGFGHPISNWRFLIP